MRFESITFRRFGLFDDVTLDVSQGNFGLHLIHGANEAGKTTALRGLGYFLFGFPTRKCDDYRYGSGEQRIGGKLKDRQGRELHCLRRRAKKKPLRGPDDRTEVSEALFFEFLGGLTQHQFDMLFGLSHSKLVAGGLDIAKGKGDVGEALFAAGAGLAGLRRIDHRLSEQMDSLYKPRGQNQIVTVGIRNIEKQRNCLRSLTLYMEAWSAQIEALKGAEEKREHLQAERKQLRDEKSLLEAYRSALPVIGAFQDLQSDFETVKDVRLLRQDFAKEHTDLVNNGHLVINRCKSLEENIAQEKQRLNEIELHAEILAEEQTIEEMKVRFGEIEKAEKDRVANLAPNMKGHQNNAKKILREYFGGIALEEAESLRIPPAVRERIRALAESRAGLLQKLEGARQRACQLEEGIIEKEAQLQNVPQQADVEHIESLAQSILEKGPLEQNCIQLTNDIAALRSKAQVFLKRLAGCWKGALEQVGELSIPAEDTVQGFRERFDDIKSRLREYEKQHEQTEKIIRDRSRQLERLQQSGYLTTEQELSEARQERNSGLHLLRRAWLEDNADTAVIEAFVTRFSPGGNLLDALAAGVARCDHLADQMRQEADRASRLSQAQAERDEAEQESKILASKRQKNAEELGGLQAQWEDEWQPGGIDPNSPDEMMGWLKNLSILQDHVATIQAKMQEREQLGNHIQLCKDKLVVALMLDASEDEPSLAQLLQTAKKRIKTMTDLRIERQSLESDLRTLRQNHQRELNDAKEASEGFEKWKTEWSELVRVLGLTDKDDPDIANRYLQQLEQVFIEIEKAGGYESRLQGMDRDRDQFFADLISLRSRLQTEGHCECTVESMRSNIDAFYKQLKKARDIRTKRNSIEDDLATNNSQLEQLTKDAEEIAAKLHALCVEAGVTTDGDIPQAIQLSEERQRLQRRIDEEREKLHQQARGQSLEEFIVAALAARDHLEDRLLELQVREPELDQEIIQQAELAKDARDKLDVWNQASAEAADCRQEIESCCSALRENVTEYAVLHMARQVLKQSIERYRQRHQHTMLSRAAFYFRLLTDNSYDSLDVDENEDGQPVLIAQRTNPSETVGVESLSDGTRDQLFFALRLAGIEQHLQDREPMPLIIDDILVNFDDGRSKSTLVCLSELAARTQILLFTHHAHMVQLAKDAISDEVLFCHEL